MTIISIAHRLTTLKNCDEILVINHGEIAQKGTYTELIKTPGIFRDMYQGKFKVKARLVPILFQIKFKPKLYPVIVVFHTVLLMERLHDRLYDGKPDAIAAVSRVWALSTL